MNRQTDRASLLKRLDRLCDEFESQWQDGRRPVISEFVKRAPQESQSAVFCDLLAVDIEYRRDLGEAPSAADYEESFSTFTEQIQAAFCDAQDLPDTADLDETLVSRRPSASTILPTQLDGYVLLEEVAHGGMGVVYKAHQESLDRTVALKFVLTGGTPLPQMVDRFIAEARLAARLQHPGIVTIHEVGQAEGCPFFSMEYVEGQTLSDLMRDGPLPQQEAARFIKEIATTIHFAHEQGVLHRDIKPSNVMLDQLGCLRVMDFGLARHVEAEKHLTASGQILGTPGFMSPEQARGEHGRIDRRSDVYSLGALLYSLLTGRAPFESRSVADILAQVIRDNPVSPRNLNSGIDRELERICLRCLEKAPDARFGSAQSLVEALAGYLDRCVTQKKRLPKQLAIAGTVVAAGLVAATGLIIAKFESNATPVDTDLEATVTGRDDRPGLEPVDQPQLDWRSGQATLTDDVSATGQTGILDDSIQQAEAGRLNLPVTVTNSLGIQLALIPQNTTGNQEPNAPFYMGRHEVTVSQFRRFVKDADYETEVELKSSGTQKTERGYLQAENINWKTPGVPIGDQQPVRQISWNDANAFCVWLSKQENAIYRLPTLDEWKWAYRAGTSTYYYFGNTTTQVDEHAWWAGNSGQTVHDVGLLKPNAWGLYDMAGNVTVWLNTPFDKDQDLFCISAASYVNQTDNLRCESTGFWMATHGLPNCGLRVLREIEPPVDRSSVLNQLSRDNIAPYELAFAGDGDPDKAPHGLVAVLGQSLGRGWRPFSDVAVSPNGEQIVSISGKENRVRLWDAHTMQQTASFRALGDNVCFTVNGRTLAVTGDRRSAVVVFDLRNLPRQIGICQACPKGENRIHTSCLSWSPESQTLAVLVSSDKTTPRVRLWKCDERGLPLDEGVTVVVDQETDCMAVNRDATWIAVAGDHGKIRVWRFTERWEVVGELDAAGGVAELAFSPDGERLAAACGVSGCRVWNIARDTTSPALVLKGERTGGYRYQTVAFSPDSNRIASGLETWGIHLWDISDSKPSSAILVEPLRATDFIRTIAFSTDGESIISGHADCMVRVSDITQQPPQPRVLPDGHWSRHARVEYVSQDGSSIFTRSLDDRLICWRVSGGHIEQSAVVELPGSTRMCVVDLTGSLIATASPYDPSGTIVLLDRKNERAMLRSQLTAEDNVSRLAMSPDGSQIAVTTTGGQVQLWDVTRGNHIVIDQFLPDQTDGHGIAFSQNGRLLAASGKTEAAQARIRIWDISQSPPKHLSHLDSAGESPARELTFSPKGKLLVQSGVNNVIVTDISGDRAEPIFATNTRGSAGQLSSFSPDGTMIAMHLGDETLQVRNTKSFKVLREWKIPAKTHPVFAPDSRHLLTGNASGTAYVLRVVE